jgi:hypothetical protein
MRIHPGLAAATVCAFTSLFGVPSLANPVTFGSGANTFNMEFVPIGNPGNAADTTGAPNPAGAVGYKYGIGKFEVSEDMITKYNLNFGTANNLAITTTSLGANKPAGNITWVEAARFVNWLNTSQGYQAAYKFANSSTITANIQLWTSTDPGYNSSNQYRNSLAEYFLPSYDEWYKAAYYDPSNSTYYDYPTGSNTAPTSVASGTLNNTAVFSPTVGALLSPADVNNAGGLSPYGVMALGGNISEWEESCDTTITSPCSAGTNNNVSGDRIRRGGAYSTIASSLDSNLGLGFAPFNNESPARGFRVARADAAPVPGPLPLLGAAAAYGWSRQLRKRIKLDNSVTPASKPS